MPPVVLAVAPAEGSTITATSEPLVIRFDERISEQNLRDAVVVSPVTGAVTVDKGRRELEVRLAGGWQAGHVYRVTVRPVVRDLFGNTIPRPLSFAFSTGAPFPESAVGGVVYDRITGQPAADARVEAWPPAGGPYHLALAGEGGSFALPLLPPGEYVLRAYVDANRDRALQEFEASDSVRLTLGATDTIIEPLALLRPDSTAARVTRAEVVDSQAVAVEFDDYMDAAEPQQLTRVQLWRLPDSTAVPLAGVLYPAVYDSIRVAIADSIAALDSLAAETLAIDSLAGDPAARTPEAEAARELRERLGVRDSVPRAARPPGAEPIRPREGEIAVRTPEQVGRAARDTTAAVDTLEDALLRRVRGAELLPGQDAVLPTRRLILRTRAPLEPGVTYRVAVEGVLNLSGLPGGGGTTTLEAPVPPEPALEVAPEAPEPDAGVAPAPEPEPESGAADPADGESGETGAP